MAKGRGVPDLVAGRRWLVARPHADDLSRQHQPAILLHRIPVRQGRVLVLCGELLGRDGTRIGWSSAFASASAFSFGETVLSFGGTSGRRAYAGNAASGSRCADTAMG